MVLATSFIWGLSLTVLVESPTDYDGYIGLMLALAIIGFLATERVQIESGKIRFYRFFWKVGEADVADVEMKKAKVGTPPLISGFVFMHRGCRDRVGEIVSGNYRESDIDNLRQALQPPE